LEGEDGSHPLVAGSFLAASILLQTIFGVVPGYTPGNLFGYEI
jgi:hypothetical protein